MIADEAPEKVSIKKAMWKRREVGEMREKNAPQEEKKMWFESTRGLNLKEGGKAK